MQQYEVEYTHTICTDCNKVLNMLACMTYGQLHNHEIQKTKKTNLCYTKETNP